MRRYKKNRAKRRSAWETYNYWYDKKTATAAGKRKYHERLSEKKFYEEYKKAKLNKWKNPAKSIAEAQRKIDYSFQKEYERVTNQKLKIEDYETKESRQRLFWDFVDKYEDLDEGRDQFEDLYNE